MKRFIKDFEDSMAAAAFAEAGEFKTARNILNEMGEAREEMKAVQVKDERIESLMKKHDRTEEAIVFAQAGEHEYARELMKKTEEERKKILIVGGEEGFSEKLIHYAISMAERMNHDIVALNVIPVGRRLFSFLNEKVKDELRQDAEAAVETFREKAAESGVTFDHTVKFGDFDRAIREAHREHKRISFVLAEPEQLAERESSRKASSIPVFCLAQES